MKRSALAAASRAAVQVAGWSPQTKRLALHGVGFGGVAAGGAVTGYLASGTMKGAAIGSLVHVALFGLAGAIFGVGRLTGAERGVYGVLGLGAAGGAGYLFYTRRR